MRARDSSATKRSIYPLRRAMDCFASLAMTIETAERKRRHFFTLLASILMLVSSILVENAVPTSNGFSMPR